MKIDENKIAYCRKLYLEQQGRDHKLIEKWMHEAGHSFSVRSLYYSKGRPGWIEKYGWKRVLSDERQAVTSDQAKGVSSPTVREGSTLDTQHGSVAGGPSGACGDPSDQTGGNTSSPPAGGGVSAALGRRGGGRRECALLSTGHQGTRATAPVFAPSSASPAIEDLSFHFWLKTVSPGFTWDWAYQKLLYKKLRDVTSGKTKRLMIFLPPRHGKSELVTVRYAAWRLQRDPKLNIIVGSYNQKLANRFSRKIKQTLSDAVTIAARLKRGEPIDVPTILPVPRRAQAEPTASAGGRESGCSTTVPPRGRSGTVFRVPASLPTADAGGSASRPINTAEEWETRSGGTLRAVGVGGGITGYGAGLVIIDDPVKSRAEAESKTIRDKVSDWFNDDLYTRLEPDAPIILIQTRWHEDDLAGRLLKESEEEGAEKWDVVSLPAICEGSDQGQVTSGESGTAVTAVPSGVRGGSPFRHADRSICCEAAPPTGGTAADRSAGTGGKAEPSRTSSGTAAPIQHSALRDPHSIDPIGRVPGEPLCPKRFGLKELERIRTKLGTYSFSALYQQRPVPPEGSIFKRNWFKVIDKAPPGLRWKRGYDLAISTRDTADFTATFKCAFDKDGNLYIGDGFRSRMNYPEQRRYIFMKLMQERDVEHGIEDALHARAVVQDLQRNSAFRSSAFRTVRVTEDKITRALTWSTLAEEGKVFLVRAGWNRGLIEEAAMFPKGANDDQIDAISIAVGMLSRVRHYAVGF